MKTNDALKLVAIAAALSLAACSKKKPAELPPPPIGGDGAAGQDGAGIDGAGGSSGGVGTVGLPGSRADFLASVPSETILFETDSFSVDAQDRAFSTRRPHGCSATAQFASRSRAMPTSAALASIISRSATAAPMPPRIIWPHAASRRIG
jgi:predicted small lipoprotein YifL